MSAPRPLNGAVPPCQFAPVLQLPLVALVQFVMTGVALIEIVATLLVAPSPSVAVKVKLCAPVKPPVGV